METKVQKQKKKHIQDKVIRPRRVKLKTYNNVPEFQLHRRKRRRVKKVSKPFILKIYGYPSPKNL